MEKIIISLIPFILIFAIIGGIGSIFSIGLKASDKVFGTFLLILVISTVAMILILGLGLTCLILQSQS